MKIGRHSHPQARPEAAPAPAPTGIDYLGLLAERRDAELARSINYSQLTVPGTEEAAGTAGTGTVAGASCTTDGENEARS